MKRAKRCVHCLTELTPPAKSGTTPLDTAATKDHVFPKQWFPDNTPQNLNRWTVPACARCNRELGAIEKRLLNTIILCLDVTRPEIAGIYQRVKKGLAIGLTEEERKQLEPNELHAREQEKKKLLESIRPLDELSSDEAKSIFPGLGVWDTPQRQFTLTIKEKDIRREAEKMVRGCEYQIAKRYVEPPYAVEVHFVHEGDVPDEIWKIVEKSAVSYDIGAAFRVKRATPHDEPLVVFYRIDFWGHVVVYAFIDRQDATVPLAQ